MQTKIISSGIQFETTTISVTIETLGELTALFAFFNLPVKLVKERAFHSNNLAEFELTEFCQRHADFAFVDTSDNPFDTLYDLTQKYLRQEQASVQVNRAGSPAQSCD